MTRRCSECDAPLDGLRSLAVHCQDDGCQRARKQRLQRARRARLGITGRGPRRTVSHAAAE